MPACYPRGAVPLCTRALPPLLALAVPWGCGGASGASAATAETGTQTGTGATGTGTTAATDATRGTASTAAATTTTGTTGAGSASTAGSGTTGAGDTGQPMLCNGAAHLCDRPLDRVIFPGTHNSYAATEAGFASIAANQYQTIATQLDDGIRLLLLDVTEDGGETALCHQFCTLGKIPHLEVLADIRAFLEANPHEVLAIVYQDEVDGPTMEADMQTAGLVPYLYTHTLGDPWPTLRDLIEAGTRLVVFAEVGGPPPAWWHHAWDHIWDTPYSFGDVSEFSCDPNRGDPANPLFQINHWLSNALGLPDESRAAEANAYDVLDARIQDCLDAHGRLPTFLAVDFYDVGDLFAVVADRNAP